MGTGAKSGMGGRGAIGRIAGTLKSDSAQVVLAALFVAVAGEFKITPFNGEVFRIGLGSSAFLLVLLFFRQQPFLRMGLAAAAAVLLFRTGLDLAFGAHSSILGSLRMHFSASVYYLVFAAGMSRLQPRLDKLHPALLGLIVTAVDFAANESELLARNIIAHAPFDFTQQWVLIAVVAIVRSYFMIGLFSSFAVNQMRVVQDEQQKRMEQMLSIGSGLYGEAFYLKKSMDTIERITARSHDLYSRLNEAGHTALSRSILEITQQIHEVKKDSQRILAGLLKLSDREIASEMTLHEIVDFVLKSNRAYSRMLNVEAEFEAELLTDYATAHSIPLLTVLNNLTANAVEAIGGQGTIRLRVYEQRGETNFTVSDSGPGIAPEDAEMVFEPGFTTKFNQDGVAATGIGLSHVRDIVRSFGGTIRLLDTAPGGETTFVAAFPSAVLKRGVQM
jgi:two-component system sensor histidine kinase YcbA